MLKHTLAAITLLAASALAAAAQDIGFTQNDRNNNPGPRDRAAIHKQTTDSILNFLSHAISAK